MSLAFSQEEIESVLNSLLKHGRREDIAKKIGLHPSTIKRQLNPDDETPSALYRTLQIICALNELDETEGAIFLDAFLSFVYQSKKRRTDSKPASLAAETGKLNCEIGDFVRAKLEDKPFQVQLKELMEAQAQLEKVKETLLDEYNEIKNIPREYVFSVARNGSR